METGSDPAEKTPGGLDRLRARLVPEDLETSYLRELLVRKRRHLAFILLCVSVISLLYMIPDALLLADRPRGARFNHWLSITFSVYSLGTIVVLYSLRRPRRWQIALSLWWLLAILTIGLGNTSYPPESVSYMLLDVLVPVAICLLIPIGFFAQLGLALLFVLLDLTILLGARPTLAASDTALVVASLLTGLILGGTLCWQNHISERKSYLRQLREQQATTEAKRLLDEVHTLRGILPMCSYCKQIRDDSGYWHQVERYIKQHSEADFTHGICPDCLAEHFPREFALLHTGKKDRP